MIPQFLGQFRAEEGVDYTYIFLNQDNTAVTLQLNTTLLLQISLKTSDGENVYDSVTQRFEQLM